MQREAHVWVTSPKCGEHGGQEMRPDGVQKTQRHSAALEI